MKHGACVVTLFLAAALTALPPARAQHEEHQRGPQAKRQPAPLRHPGPGGRPQFPQQHPQPRPQIQARPQFRRPPTSFQARSFVPPQPRANAHYGEPLRVQTRRPVQMQRPVQTPRPASAANARRPRPRPIADPKRFLHKWSPPPSPKTGPNGAALSAQPRHAGGFNNAAVAASIVSNQKNETQPDHYYWHDDGGLNYVHSYSGGVHWYGFSAGSNYYWSRVYAGRWWWYDPGDQRYLYYDAGAWWWQDPAQPQTVYEYQNNVYVPYAVENAEAGSNGAVVNSAPAGSAEPPAPRYHSDVDAPNYSLAPNPNRFALVIGVENYATLPAAYFAERDAGAMRAHLSALGYPDRNVVVLTSSQAARASVSKYVESWLPEHTTADSRVLVYFSGHGAPDPKNGSAYLMPWDGDAKYLTDTGYPLKRLYEKLNALPAREIVVVLDSCFSGAGGRSVLVAGARPLVTKIDVGRGETGRLVVFTASGPDEITGTLPDQGHGLFTYYFLKGLNGEAAATDDGVTVQALFDDLSPNVQDAARRDNRDQAPQLSVPPEGQRQMLIKDLRSSRAD